MTILKSVSFCTIIAAILRVIRRLTDRIKIDALLK